MATKSKSFDKNKLFCTLLAAAYLICFFAIGVITGFAPACGYLKNGTVIDTLFADNYYSSKEYINKLYETAADLVESGDIQLATSNKQYVDKDYLWSYDKYGNLSDDAAAVFNIENGRITAEKGVQPKIDYNFPTLLVNYKIGFSEDQLLWQIEYFEAVQKNLRIIVVSDAVLLILSVVILVLLCRRMSSSSDEEKRVPILLSVFYEIELAVLILAAWLIAMCANEVERYGHNYLIDSMLGRRVFMCICGLALAGLAALLLWLVCSIAARYNNRTLFKGSIILMVLSLIFRALKFCGKNILRFLRFIKELFTGELFTADTAAKKIITVNCIFAAVTVMNIILGIICFAVFDPSTAAFFVIVLITLEIALFALFCYGKSLILKDGAMLEKQIRMMYDGDYSYRPQLSKNSPYKASSEHLSKIAEQYRENMKKSIQAERTKIELVTNVSHDLKTPLTSIISYIELLSKEELSPAAADYVKVLKNKSARLKSIISDVFELAKTTSGEISVEHERIDLSKLSHQTLCEMEDRIAKSGLEVRQSIADPPVTIISDGKRIYRILQNLLDNALKYSLAGTRIYFSLEKDEKRAIITIKNISSYEMTFTKEEILERFTRGDKSRSTEGSGLGLSIAQGFTIACGGDFDIELDGDMFKTRLTFPLESSQPELAPTAINEISEEQPAVSGDNNTSAGGEIPSPAASEGDNQTNGSNDAAEITTDISPKTEVKA